MHVGELAKHTGASTRSLHYYEQMGVLHAQRQENGYRCYDESAIEQVRYIRSLLALGFTLADIQLLAPCLAQQESGAPLCTAALARYLQKIATIDEHIHLLQNVRQNILQRIQVAQASHTEEKNDDY